MSTATPVGRVLILFAGGLWALHASAQFPDYAGRPIVELIEDLRDQGNRIVYARDLLPARLLVEATPTANDTFEALSQILAPHGLAVRQGPQDTWLIGRAAADSETASDVAPRRLTLIPPTLETVIVTASRYPIAGRQPSSVNSFERQTLESTPSLGQDPLRVTHRLPGVTSDQLTSRAHVRGGDLDEVLILLDGVRLYAPYHLKDFRNVFSSINPRTLESMDVRTGGYEARYGDSLSGVIAMQTVHPDEPRHHEISVSFLETSVLSSGVFSQGRGSWVTSLRRGNLDVASDLGDSDIGTPQYVDFYNKVALTLSPEDAVEIGMLSLDDKISLRDGDLATAAADYGDNYFWVTLLRSHTSGLEATYRITSARLKRTRNGEIDDPSRTTATLAESGRFRGEAVTAQWSYPTTDSLWIDWGAQFEQARLNHRVQSARTPHVDIAFDELNGPNDPPANTDLKLDQSRKSAFVSLRYQPVPRLITEFGLRWDSQSVTGERQTGPRINLLFNVSDRTQVRAAWGRFSQADSLADLAVADGIAALQPAEESTHSVVGIEYAFGDSGSLRAEVYEKRTDQLSRRFENVFDRVSLLPELLPDRFELNPRSARTRGAEVSIEGTQGAFGWWANVSLARTRERHASGTYRRSWDERRSIKVGGEWSGNLWTVTTFATHRSGWPISRVRLSDGSLVARDFNGSRLPGFSSLDVRASRGVEIDRGELDWFVEVSNVLNHDNACCLNYAITVDGSLATLSQEFDTLLGIVPNLGIRWQF